jgi:hypothetical protein
MEKREKNLIAAAIVYVMLALFAVAAPMAAFGEPPWVVWARVKDLPEGVELFSVLAALAIVSVVFAAVLWHRRRVSKSLLGASIVVAVGAVSWNIVAIAMWGIPAFLIWRSYANAHDA